MMICRILSLTLLVATNVSHAAVVFVDNFDTGTLGDEWSFNESVGTANLNQNGGVFEFTGNYASVDERTRVSYTNNIRLSSASDWTVSVDMHLDALSSFGSEADFSGLLALNTLSISNGFSSDDRVQFNMILIDQGSSISHAYRFASDTGATPDFNYSELTNSNDTAQNATITLSYDSIEQEITASLNTGSGMETFGSNIADTSSWVLGEEEFVINLESLIGPYASEDGRKVSIDVASGMMSYDNFIITAVPEPASAASLLGVLTLGLASTRRKR